ncbi:MAG: methyl-accepting chemotaxis protein [Solirubrobacterales bacterium]
MTRRLLNMPLTRAYMITTIVAVIPALGFGLYYVVAMIGANGNASSLRDQATGAGAKIDAGQLAGVGLEHSVWVWVAGLVITFLFAGAAIRIVLGNITLKTVDEMVVEMRAAARGDLSVKLEVTMNNEYGDLQREFARLVGNFRGTIERIDVAARELRSASMDMSHTSDEAGGAIGEVAQAIGAISEGAAHQVELVGRSAAHIDSIDQSVRDAHEHVDEVRRQSADAGALADAGLTRAHAVESAMQITRDAAYSTAAIVRELGDRSGDIDLIVQSIAEIANQTNMLALNASIEAARAGDQGRGFANVADEVRVLAEDAQRAVAEIGDVVGEIGRQTSGAVEAMEAGIARVEDSTETVARNRQIFTDISASIHSLGERSAEIGELTAEIVKSAERARTHVGEVAAVAQQSSASTEEVSASTEETSAASEEVSASAQHVADTAAVLAELSGRFTLPERSAA